MPRIQTSPPCTVCREPSLAKRLCRKHYMRFQRHGHTEQTRPKGWGQKEKHPLYDSWWWTKRAEAGRVDRWNDFWLFVEDVGERPNPSSRLSRYDAGKPFGPENCYWGEVTGPLPTTSTRADRAIWQRMYRRKKKLEHAGFEMKRGFGISLQDYDRMMEAQNDVCAICGEKCKHFALAIDHCHATKKIRGLLCALCNLGLGQFKDDPVRLRNAAAYLEKSRDERG